MERWKDQLSDGNIPLVTFVNVFVRAMGRRSASGLLLFIAVLMVVGRVQAEPFVRPILKPGVPFPEHVHRDFSVRDGLPSSWINDVLQTRDGFVWIATDNGLARYDGLRFSTVNRATNPQLPSNETRVLFESSDGNLWIGSTSGLARYRSGRPPTIENVSELHRTTVFAIQEDSSGALWVGTLQGTYIRTRELEFE
ncbi:MAG: two-component regulator propeller domain-containing protein, partial [Pirellulaceae bacterium]